jgi:hypothetical protein
MAITPWSRIRGWWRPYARAAPHNASIIAQPCTAHKKGQDGNAILAFLGF